MTFQTHKKLLKSIIYQGRYTHFTKLFHLISVPHDRQDCKYNLSDEVYGTVCLFRTNFVILCNILDVEGSKYAKQMKKCKI